MAFNNNYTAIIQNPQHTFNTTVQPSQLNGGNLAQIFNLQAMRMVKGRAYVPDVTNVLFSGTGVISNVIFNEHDGFPITLGPNDFIVAYAVANGNPIFPGDMGPLYNPTQFAGTGFIDIQTASPPSYSVQTGLWTPGINSSSSIIGSPAYNNILNPQIDHGQPGYGNPTITSPSTGINKNYGLLLPSTATTSPMGANQWLNVLGGYGFTSAGYINVTLLVLSGIPAQ